MGQHRNRMKPGVRKISADVSHPTSPGFHSPTSPGFHRRRSKGAYEQVESRSAVRKASFDTLSMGSPKSPKAPLYSMQSPLYKDENDHVEPHFVSSDIIRDVVIGLSDGLTVPFALAAGLAAFDDSKIVVIAGMAEMAAGAISMGMGGYLAGNLEIEHYDAERLREQFEVETAPEREEEEIVEIFEPFGLSKRDIMPLLTALKKDPEKWVDFMMKFELGLERPSKYQTWISAITIGTSYLTGGLIPLLPYMIIASAKAALYYSLAFTLIALFIFGYVKGRLIGSPNPSSSALSMMLLGGMAAGCAYAIASGTNSKKFKHY